MRDVCFPGGDQPAPKSHHQHVLQQQRDLPSGTHQQFVRCKHLRSNPSLSLSDFFYSRRFFFFLCDLCLDPAFFFIDSVSFLYDLCLDLGFLIDSVFSLGSVTRFRNFDRYCFLSVCWKKSKGFG